MNWGLKLQIAVRVVAAAGLGGFVGWERHWHGREAGIRTYAAIAVGLGSIDVQSGRLGGWER